MSLVNLAHVCSHLQNASLARLGLTSIPYTKLHLSLSLLLHKQGFLSQVKVGGPAPPASCFPGTIRNNDRISAQPHVDRDPHRTLQDYGGFQNELSKEQLERDGWDEKACDYIVQHRTKTRGALEDDGHDSELAALVAKYYDTAVEARLTQELLLTRLAITSSRLSESDILQAIEQLASSGTLISIANVEAQLRANIIENHKGGEMTEEELAQAEKDLNEASLYWDKEELNRRLRHHLKEQGFEAEELKLFAKEQRFVTPRHLANDGVTIEAMGLSITNQPFTPVPEEYQDPWQLEAEGIVTQANRASRRLWLGLKYWEGHPVLSKARMLSKPTKRIWLNHHDIGKVVRGREAGEIKPMTRIGEIIAVSTDRGILEARECVERKIGGQMLCRVW